LSHQAGPRVLPVLRSRFSPFLSRFRFPIIQHHSVSSSGSRRAITSHDTHTHTLSLSLSLARGLTRRQHPLYSPFAPPFPLQDRGHVSDTSLTTPELTAWTLHLRHIINPSVLHVEGQMSVHPNKRSSRWPSFCCNLGFELARLARACSGASHWSVIRLKTRHILLDLVLLPVFHGRHCMSLRTIKLTP